LTGLWKIASRPEAFLDYALIKNLAVRISIDFRIFADLFEAIDPNALSLPQNLTRASMSSARFLARMLRLAPRNYTGCPSGVLTNFYSQFDFQHLESNRDDRHCECKVGVLTIWRNS